MGKSQACSHGISLNENSNFFTIFGGLKNLCETRQLHEALRIVSHMHQKGIYVSADIFYLLLQGCINKRDAAAGSEVHRLIIRSGFEADVFLGSHLIRLFGLCGKLCEASQVFSKLVKPNVFTWCAAISAYANIGHINQAIQLYDQMRQSSVKANEYIYTAMLKACASRSVLPQGKLIHDHVARTGFESMIIVSNALVDMYAKCSRIEDARQVFDNVPMRNVVTWTAMIAGYAQLRYGHEALQLFQQMGHDGTEPNHVTYISVLRACTSVAALDQGMLVHALIIKNGFGSTVVIGNSLIDMYGKCGSLNDALSVFDKLANRNVVSWTVMIAGYVHYGHDEGAVQLFQQMQLRGMKPDNVTFVSILKACPRMVGFNQGQLLHTHIMASGFELDLNVGSTLINMYVNCGNLEDAYRVFKSLPKRNVVICTAMIAGYAEFGHCQEAVGLYKGMQQEGMESDGVIFVSVLKACSDIAALHQGKLIHSQIIEDGFESDVNVGCTLVDFFSKCGNLKEAQKVFDMLPKPDVVSWTAMISGYAECKNYKLALTCFEDMQRKGLRPDDVTYVCLLSACSHMGLVDKGCHLFKSMQEDHGITPALDHYDCMINLLGHAGYLTMAKELLQTMPFRNSDAGWTSFLNLCQTYGNVDLGRHCFDHIVTTNGRDASIFVIMSSIYTDSGIWEGAAKIQELRNCAQVWKKPGRAFIEVNNEVHGFIVGDKTHPQSDDIYAKLKALNMGVLERHAALELCLIGSQMKIVDYCDNVRS